MSENRHQDDRIKVTDKRMFTADGELREGFRHLDEAGRGSAAAVEAEKPPTTEEIPVADTDPGAEAHEVVPEPQPAGAGDVGDSLPPGALGSPGFMELVGVLAEPIAIYLGDAKLPDGSTEENLDAARFYIDMLEVLRSKTTGNLSAEEASVLHDLLYQLRMRYVRKRG